MVVEHAIQKRMEFDQTNITIDRMSKNKILERTHRIEEREVNGSLMRINSNVQINRIKKKMSYRIVIKDTKGEVKLVMAAVEAREGSKILEETNAINLALMLAKQRGLMELQIEETNQSLIQTMNSQEPQNSNCATVIENVIYISSMFNLYSFIIDQLVR